VSTFDEGDSLEVLLNPLHDPSSDKMEEKRGALVDILRMVREDSASLWNSFPKVFVALAKAVDDVQVCTEGGVLLVYTGMLL
jgi:hypothetical protein